MLRPVVLFIALVAVSFSAIAQDPTIRVQVQLVNVLVTARDAAGILSGDLTKDDFVVLDEGKPQDIRVFDRQAGTPLAITLLVPLFSRLHFPLSFDLLVYTCLGTAFLRVALGWVWYSLEDSKVARSPGWRLHRLGSLFFSPKTFKNVLEPVLSDMQVEIFEALSDNRPFKARWVQIRGYWTFWQHLALQIPVSVGHVLLALWRAI